jgi:hypothetical protein
LHICKEQNNIRRLSIVPVCFSSLGEALQPDYNSVANVVKKGRIPATVLNFGTEQANLTAER